jgi:hypothetical protein
MATIRYLGPPEHEIGLIGYGLVSPGAVISIDNALADQLIASGRAEVIEATKEANAPNPDKRAATKTSPKVEETGKTSAIDQPTVPAGAVDQERASDALNKDKP